MLSGQEYSFASLYMKNLMSVTPLNCVLNALILGLRINPIGEGWLSELKEFHISVIQLDHLNSTSDVPKGMLFQSMPQKKTI